MQAAPIGASRIAIVLSGICRVLVGGGGGGLTEGLLRMRYATAWYEMSLTPRQEGKNERHISITVSNL